MATNQLLRFANGNLPNIIEFDEWQNQPEVSKGFVSGIAKSSNINRVLAQGALASWIVGQLIVEQLSKDVTLDSETIFNDFKSSIAKFVPGLLADKSIDGAKIADQAITWAKLAATIIATQAEAQAGTANNKLMTPERVLDALYQFLPSGVIVAYAGKTKPAGWLKCDGSLIPRSSYSRLFSAIGTTWGAGDGSTTFQLPNVNGRVLQGTSNEAEVGNYLEASLPNITGTVGVNANGVFARSTGAFSGVTRDSESQSVYEINSAVTQVQYKYASFSAQLSNAVYSGSTLKIPSAQTLMIIKV